MCIWRLAILDICTSILACGSAVVSAGVLKVCFSSARPFFSPSSSWHLAVATTTDMKADIFCLPLPSLQSSTMPIASSKLSPSQPHPPSPPLRPPSLSTSTHSARILNLTNPSRTYSADKYLRDALGHFGTGGPLTLPTIGTMACWLAGSGGRGV